MSIINLNNKFYVTFILMILAFVGFAYAAEQQVFVLNLRYDGSTITFEDITVTEGILNKIPNRGNFKLDIISFDDEVIYSQNFDLGLVRQKLPNPEWFDDEGRQIYIPTEDETIIKLDETTKELVVPYFQNAKQIIIFNEENEKVLEIPVLQFADTCGNNICEPQESYESCQLDCSSGLADDFCDSISDNICDPDCAIGQDTDCKVEEVVSEGTETEKPSILALILASLVLVATIVLGYFEFSKIKDKKILGENYRDKNSLRLKTYIEKELNNGISEKRIRDVLIENGWKERKVEEAFKGVR